MSVVMGLDQHRAQISAEWLDTITGEVSRARIMPADRAGVRTFREQFSDCGLEVALEATTGWRFVVEELEAIGAEAHLAEPAEAAALKDNQQSVLAFRLAAAQPAMRSRSPLRPRACYWCISTTRPRSGSAVAGLSLRRFGGDGGRAQS